MWVPNSFTDPASTQWANRQNADANRDAAPAPILGQWFVLLRIFLQDLHGLE